MQHEIHVATYVAQPGDPAGYPEIAVVEIILDAIERMVGLPGLIEVVRFHEVMEVSPGTFVAIVVTSGLAELAEAQVASLNRELSRSSLSPCLACEELGALCPVCFTEEKEECPF